MKVNASNMDMLLTACEQFLGKPESEIRSIARETLEGHQRAMMGNMTVEVGLLRSAAGMMRATTAAFPLT